MIDWCLPKTKIAVLPQALRGCTKENDQIDLQEGECKMKQTNSRVVQDALKSINENYGFMLERGYEVLSVDDYDLGWQVLLKKQELFARIIRSRGKKKYTFEWARSQRMNLQILEA